jgi:hypothetical protein
VSTVELLFTSWIMTRGVYIQSLSIFDLCTWYISRLQYVLDKLIESVRYVLPLVEFYGKVAVHFVMQILLYQKVAACMIAQSEYDIATLAVAFKRAKRTTCPS